MINNPFLDDLGGRSIAGINILLNKIRTKLGLSTRRTARLKSLQISGHDTFQAVLGFSDENRRVIAQMVSDLFWVSPLNCCSLIIDQWLSTKS